MLGKSAVWMKFIVVCLLCIAIAGILAWAIKGLFHL
jgi:hypothetical protein